MVTILPQLCVALKRCSINATYAHAHFNCAVICASNVQRAIKLGGGGVPIVCVVCARNTHKRHKIYREHTHRKSLPRKTPDRTLWRKVSHTFSPPCGLMSHFIWHNNGARGRCKGHIEVEGVCDYAELRRVWHKNAYACGRCCKTIRTTVMTF